MLQTLIINAGQRLEFYEPGDFFRLLEATDPVTVQWYKNGAEVQEAPGVREGYAEEFERGTFDRIAITSATTQTIQFVVRLGNRVLYDTPPVGDTTVVGGVMLTDAQLRASPVPVRDRLEAPTGNWVNNALWGVANSSVNIFTAAANVNGAIVWAAGANDQSASGAPQSLIAKATAPATIVDGDVIAFTKNQILSGAALFYKELELVVPQRIAPGLGLWFISGFAGAAVGYRHVRFTLL